MKLCLILILLFSCAHRKAEVFPKNSNLLYPSGTYKHLVDIHHGRLPMPISLVSIIKNTNGLLQITILGPGNTTMIRGEVSSSNFKLEFVHPDLVDYQKHFGKELEILNRLFALSYLDLNLEGQYSNNDLKLEFSGYDQYFKRIKASKPEMTLAIQVVKLGDDNEVD